MGSQLSKLQQRQPKTSYESQLEDWPWVWAIRDPSNLDWKLEFARRSPEALRDHFISQEDLPVRITDQLYLGNAPSVQDTHKLQTLGITAVLNMAGAWALRKSAVQTFQNRGISYKRIDADDELDYPLLEKHWLEAKQFIEESIKHPSGKCVVHCAAGMNRSGLIVAAYYMTTTQTSVLETIKYIRKQRGNVALQNEGFQDQIVAMARQENLLGPQPGSANSIIRQQAPPPSSDLRFFQLC